LVMRLPPREVPRSNRRPEASRRRRHSSLPHRARRQRPGRSRRRNWWCRPVVAESSRRHRLSRETVRLRCWPAAHRHWAATNRHRRAASRHRAATSRHGHKRHWPAAHRHRPETNRHRPAPHWHPHRRCRKLGHRVLRRLCIPRHRCSTLPNRALRRASQALRQRSRRPGLAGRSLLSPDPVRRDRNWRTDGGCGLLPRPIASIGRSATSDYCARRSPRLRVNSLNGMKLGSLRADASVSRTISSSDFDRSRNSPCGCGTWNGVSR